MSPCHNPRRNSWDTRYLISHQDSQSNSLFPLQIHLPDKRQRQLPPSHLRPLKPLQLGVASAHTRPRGASAQTCRPSNRVFPCRAFKPRREHRSCSPLVPSRVTYFPPSPGCFSPTLMSLSPRSHVRRVVLFVLFALAGVVTAAVHGGRARTQGR